MVFPESGAYRLPAEDLYPRGFSVRRPSAGVRSPPVGDITVVVGSDPVGNPAGRAIAATPPR